jgi:Protein of unknown function (DUF3631)/Bifunctional DNA primase/polymerase, N-terminal/Primase C terminal 1 (PriCT-1)
VSARATDRAALAFTARGIPVFPVHSPNGNGGCSCGKPDCSSPAKHPRTEHGFLDATTDREAIATWWARWPSANIAMPTGKASGYDVLDVDVQHGGAGTLKRLEHEHGKLPDTVEVLTPSGGRHYVFRHVGRALKSGAGVLGLGLDTRGEGGYVLCPPSIGANGRAYKYTRRVTAAEPPEWLFEIVEEQLRFEPAPEVEEVIPEGRRRQAMLSVAGSMRRRGLVGEEILAALLELNKRCRPPLEHAELVELAFDVERRYQPHAKATVTPTAGEPVPLAPLLDKIDAFLRRFLATLSDHHYVVLTLWVAHTYVITAAETTPYLHVTSAEILSGKTRLLEALDVLVYKPAPILDPSAASLYRGLASGEIVTLLIDEVDNFLPGGKADSDAKKTILGILNGGYRRGMRVPRVTDGRRLEWFEPFGPKALTGLRGLPQTLASRALRFEMRRRRRDEAVERFRRKRALADAEPIAQALGAWATDEVVATLERAEPQLPEELNDRQQDACELLVAIADLAGDDKWPQQARKALVAVSREGHEAESSESYGTLLLADLRATFQALEKDQLSSVVLLARLNRLEERPWGSWHKGEGMRARDLARLLRPFGIRPRTVRLSDDETAKGYLLDACADAFERYLEASPPPESDTSVTTASLSQKQPSEIRHKDPLCYGLGEAANPHGSWDVTDVSDQGQGERPGDWG